MKNLKDKLLEIELSQYESQKIKYEEEILFFSSVDKNKVDEKKFEGEVQNLKGLKFPKNTRFLISNKTSHILLTEARKRLAEMNSVFSYFMRKNNLFATVIRLNERDLKVEFNFLNNIENDNERIRELVNSLRFNNEISVERKSLGNRSVISFEISITESIKAGIRRGAVSEEVM